MRPHYWLILFVCCATVWIYDSRHANSWDWDAYGSGIFLMLWLSSLKKSPASQAPMRVEPNEPAFDSTVRPPGTFEEAILTGTDAEFTYFVHEDFPFTDWKEAAEDVLEAFSDVVPGFKFSVVRNTAPSLDLVHLELGHKTQLISLQKEPEGCALIEPLAEFLWPEYVLCSYKYTEGSDTWANPVFSRELWERVIEEQPDRAALFTPVVEYHVGKKGRSDNPAEPIS